jgi:hypothetical protein
MGIDGKKQRTSDVNRVELRNKANNFFAFIHAWIEKQVRKAMLAAVGT